MRYSVCIFLLLFLLCGCSLSGARGQYGLNLKEFPIDCGSLIKSIDVDRLGDAEFSSEVTQVDENMVKYISVSTLGIQSNRMIGRCGSSRLSSLHSTGRLI